MKSRHTNQISKVFGFFYIFILLFGVNKIPQLMKGLGRGIKDFKDEMKDDSKIEDGEEK